MDYEWDEKIFIAYEEIEKTGKHPLMKDNLLSERYENQEKIAEYLYNAEVFMTEMSYARDIFTGKLLPQIMHCVSDDKYWWPIILAYYVQKYNLRLPKEFEQHILEKISDGNINIEFDVNQIIGGK